MAICSNGLLLNQLSIVSTRQKCHVLVYWFHNVKSWEIKRDTDCKNIYTLFTVGRIDLTRGTHDDETIDVICIEYTYTNQRITIERQTHNIYETKDHSIARIYTGIKVQRYLIQLIWHIGIIRSTTTQKEWYLHLSIIFFKCCANIKRYSPYVIYVRMHTLYVTMINDSYMCRYKYYMNRYNIVNFTTIF